MRRSSRKPMLWMVILFDPLNNVQYIPAAEAVGHTCIVRTKGFCALSDTAVREWDNSPIATVLRPTLFARSKYISLRELTAVTSRKYRFGWYIRCLPFSPFREYDLVIKDSCGNVLATLTNASAFSGVINCIDCEYSYSCSGDLCLISDADGEVVFADMKQRKLRVGRSVPSLGLLVAFVLNEVNDYTGT